MVPSDPIQLPWCQVILMGPSDPMVPSDPIWVVPSDPPTVLGLPDFHFHMQDVVRVLPCWPPLRHRPNGQYEVGIVSCMM